MTVSFDDAVRLPVASGRATWTAVRRLARPYQRLVVGGTLVLLGATLAALVLPLLLGAVVDVVVEGRPAGDLDVLVVGLVVATVAQGVLFGFGSWAVGRLGELVLTDLREQVVDRALAVPLEDVERAGTGDLVARACGDVDAVAEAMREAIPEIVASSLIIALTVVGLATLDPWLALAGLAALPIQAGAARWYLRRSRPLYAAERAAEGARSQRLHASVTGARTIRALRLQGPHMAGITGTSRRAVDLAVAAASVRARFFSALNAAELVGLGTVLAVSYPLVRNDAITVGGATAAALYFYRLFDPIGALLTQLDTAQSAGAALARLVGVSSLPTHTDRPDGPSPHGTDARPVVAATGVAGRASEVHAAADAADADAEEPSTAGANGGPGAPRGSAGAGAVGGAAGGGVGARSAAGANGGRGAPRGAAGAEAAAEADVGGDEGSALDVAADGRAAGERGWSGEGGWTGGAELPEVRVRGVRFSYGGGRAALDGVDLVVGAGERVALVGPSGAGKSTVAKLVAGVHGADEGVVEVVGPGGSGGRVALVTQEVHVFAGPLAADLRLARPDATDDELHAALDRVGAMAWVAALDDGLATVVGESGHRLSATQAQQLALARLLLADPAVAILDEATAEAGSAGAGELEAAAEAVVAGRTSLVIAHRLTQAAAADRIVVLDQGRVVEQGTHDELLAAGGLYATLWSAWATTAVAPRS